MVINALISFMLSWKENSPADQSAAGKGAL